LRFNIAPYKVVVDYTDTLRAAGYLPVTMIPSWDKPMSISASGSNQDSEPGQGPERKQKATSASHELSSDNDIEMVEAGPSSTARSMRQSKEQVRPDNLSIGGGESQAKWSGTETRKDGLDLSKYVYANESTIDHFVFPKVVGAVSSTNLYLASVDSSLGLRSLPGAATVLPGDLE
jgi:hypothetical protein